VTRNLKIVLLFVIFSFLCTLTISYIRTGVGVTWQPEISNEELDMMSQKDATAYMQEHSTVLSKNTVFLINFRTLYFWKWFLPEWLVIWLFSYGGLLLVQRMSREKQQYNKSFKRDA